MYISELFKKTPLISFEIFPPKKEQGMADIEAAVGVLAKESPAFISVTCGAGGSGSPKTAQVASMVKRAGAEPLAHITCIGTRREDIDASLTALRREGIENVLALRGDFPAGQERTEGDFERAQDLICHIAAYGGFCIGAAAYPEGHVACQDLALDSDYLKRKQDAGASFFVSQLFFDNEYFYRFMDRARRAGVTLPITAGVMPILSRAQIERMIFMVGASLPSPIIKLLHRYERDAPSLRAAGIEYALRQMEDLLQHGAQGVHVYTMNHPDIAKSAMARLR